MKLHILSDLHLEHSPLEPPVTLADVVVLAGDIAPGYDGLAWARDSFPTQEIIYVAGNHEFYNHCRYDVILELRRKALELGIHFLDNDAVILQNPINHAPIRFLGTTLWTDFEFFGLDSKDLCMNNAAQKLNDFWVIREGIGKFTPSQSIEIHQASLNWLKAALEQPFEGKTVVVTHHLPSARSVAEKFKSSGITPCFASHLDYLFGKMALWIHGHTHSSMDYLSGGTRVLCNPRGYVTTRGIENPDFNAGLVVDLDCDASF